MRTERLLYSGSLLRALYGRFPLLPLTSLGIGTMISEVPEAQGG